MIHDTTYWDGLLHDVEVTLEDVEPTWHKRWAEMPLIEKTHFLNVDLLDVDRYLAKLRKARSQELLTEEQLHRLARAIVARERAKPTIAAMVAQVVEDERTRLQSSA